MKIVVVDDEKSVMKGLRYIFKKYGSEYEIVGMAESANEALQILRQSKVDVVITDIKMPGMNGIELTREIRRLHPSVAVVILSGYAEFELVRQAMKDGAVDYLLKPCHYREVLDILHKIEEKVQMQEREQEERAYKQWLERLIAGQEEAPESWKEEPEMMMAVIAGKDVVDLQLAELIRPHAAKWDLSGNLHTLMREGNCVVFSRRPAADPAEMMRCLDECRLHLRKRGYTIYVGLLRFHVAADCMARAYKTCKIMIEFLQFHEMSAVLDYDTYARYLEEQRDFSVSCCLSGKEIARCFAGADAKKLLQYVEAGLNKLRRLPFRPDPGQLKRKMLGELFYMEHVLKEQGIDTPFGRSADSLQGMENVRTYSEWLTWLKNYFMSLIMFMNDENQIPQYIKAAVRYIELNYMDDLSLKTVADAVYLNPWYFSTQFKKYMNMSFSEYLTLVRVRFAKEFLKQRDLKVYQVAEMVGFHDAAYFSTVFKSIEHMTPREYQKWFA